MNSGFADAVLPTRPRVRIGVDLVDVDQIARSLADFGARFAERVFTPGELEAARTQAGYDLQKLAARFAAKEATIKALDLAEAGVGWRQIEVQGGGRQVPRVVLHGRAAECANAAGIDEIALSLSHEGGWACAMVVALPNAHPGASPSTCP